MKANLKAIKSAMNEVTGEVPAKSGERAKSPFSLVSQVASLELGQCCSQVQRIDHRLTVGEIAETLTTMKDALRNRVMPSIRVARANTQGQYIVEIAPLVTTPGQMYLVAVITRIE